MDAVEPAIGKIKKVNLREIWKHEAIDFTTWMRDNPDVISEVVGINLVNVESETSTGNFNVDLLAETLSGETVVIENQLEKSDHDHLGKIITYLTSFDAKIAIWICSEPRAEHIKAIGWLNESTDCRFFLIKLEGVKIGDSSPAPLLTLIAGPSDLSKDVGSAKREISEKHRLRYSFWERLLARSREKHQLFSSISPSDYTWVGAGSGKTGIQYTFWLTKSEVKIILYIDRGKGKEEDNLSILKKLEGNKGEIEAAFGHSLEWLEMPDNRACEVRFIACDKGLDAPGEEWEAMVESATSEMVNFEAAFKKQISKL